MRKQVRVSLATLIAFLALVGVALAVGTIVFDGKPGTGKPPRKLEGLRMHRFRRDHRALGKGVTTVRGPTGNITFSSKVFHSTIKNINKTGYWKTWSNGYKGDVYYSASTVTITLPSGTRAFYMYVEPNDHKLFHVTATSGTATSGAVGVHGKAGAKFFGFVAKGGAHLTSVTVSSDDHYIPLRQGGGFAVGEFGIHG